MNIRTKFYGKSYMYKDKVIGVCPTLRKELFMIGHIKPSGSSQRARIKVFPLSFRMNGHRKILKVLRSRGLTEVTE